LLRCIKKVNVSISCYKILFCIATLHPRKTFVNRVVSFFNRLSKMLKHAEDRTVIRKYANRRLYDTSASRYVTIDDLSMMVKDNIDFRVGDATSGQDITRVTLIQIILENESEGHGLLPISVLRQLIQVYGDRMEPIASRYLERTMDAFFNQQGSAKNSLGASLDKTLSGVNTPNDDHLRLIRTEFDQLKAKLDRLG